jgi:hypothetical protein
MFARMHPASTVTVLFSASSSTILLMRPRATTTASPFASGTDAPHIPVLPPCGTTGVPVSAQRLTTAATSAVVAGRTTAMARPS